MRTGSRARRSCEIELLSGKRTRKRRCTTAIVNSMPKVSASMVAPATKPTLCLSPKRPFKSARLRPMLATLVAIASTMTQRVSPREVSMLPYAICTALST